MANGIKGIDVSSHNGDINWSKVKASGIGFAILRAGYGKVASQVDANFFHNYANAKNAGIPVGAYWYSYAKTVEEAKLEAAACINTLKDTKLEYPIYYDVEENSQYKLGKAKVSAIIKAFCDTMEAAGYWVGVYTNASWYNSVLDDEVKTRYAIWIAHWGVSKPGINGSYGMWQYNIGKNNPINGISGDVDLDYAYVDYPTLIKKDGCNNWPKETPVTTQPRDTINVRIEIDGKFYEGDLTGV